MSYTDYSTQPPFEVENTNKTLRIGHIDRDGDIEIEITENYRNGDSMITYLYTEDIVRLHAHLTEQIERLKKEGHIS